MKTKIKILSDVTGFTHYYLKNSRNTPIVKPSDVYKVMNIYACEQVDAATANHDQEMVNTIHGDGFIVKVDDRFCEWEFGFSLPQNSIEDFIQAIEEKFNAKRDYSKITRHSDINL